MHIAEGAKMQEYEGIHKLRNTQGQKGSTCQPNGFFSLFILQVLSYSREFHLLYLLHLAGALTESYLQKFIEVSIEKHILTQIHARFNTAKKGFFHF